MKHRGYGRHFENAIIFSGMANKAKGGSFFKGMIAGAVIYVAVMVGAAILAFLLLYAIGGR